jgi:single-strand DNA-binding protein
MLNTASYIGYICTEPIFTGKEDTQYCKFIIAVPRNYKNENGERPADFISCIAFGISAEIIYSNFKKGNKICVSGRMESSRYTDKEGNTKYDMTLNVREWYFEEPKPKPLEYYEKAFE